MAGENTEFGQFEMVLVLEKCVCVLVVVWVVASTKNKIYAFRKLNNIRIRLVILEYQPRSHTWANKLLYRPRSALFFS